MERIEAAAIKCDDVVWSVPKPGRHHDVIAFILRERPWLRPVVGEQGFVTTEGRFVGRKEARKIAEAAEQLIPSEDNEGVPIVRRHEQLFSEDVW